MELEETEEMVDDFDEVSNPLDAVLQGLGKRNASFSNASRLKPPAKDDLDKEITMFENFPTPKNRPRSIAWWKDNMDLFPNLAPTALDIISAPATEVTVERLFSHLKFILNKHRTQMKNDLINDVLFLRMNERFEE
jgi:hAT family C-terminal dimerisation region